MPVPPSSWFQRRPRLLSVAGRIRDEDIAAVREKSPIDDVIGEHVQLRNAGGGNLKGLCPFHDEKSPSFNVTPARGLFHCFGCQAGGDVIRFVQDIEHIDFSEAVERLAGRAGVQLRYVEGGPAVQGRNHGQRAAADRGPRAPRPSSTTSSCAAPRARPAREFLAERGFDIGGRRAATGAGTPRRGGTRSPATCWPASSPPAELTLAGLSREGGRGGLIDRFHRRLLWPIREVNGDVVGFGARRLFDDDRIEAKYLNTPETPIYKKSQLLYGVDLAKKRDRPQAPGGHRRGLHRRDGLPPGRRHDGRRHLRHRLRQRARVGDPPAADGLRHLHR